MNYIFVEYDPLCVKSNFLDMCLEKQCRVGSSKALEGQREEKDRLSSKTKPWLDSIAGCFKGDLR